MNTMANAMSTAVNKLQMTNQNLDSKKLKDIELYKQKQNMKLDMKSDMMEDVLEFVDELENDKEANDIYNQVIQETGYNLEKSMRGEN